MPFPSEVRAAEGLEPFRPSKLALRVIAGNAKVACGVRVAKAKLPMPAKARGLTKLAAVFTGGASNLRKFHLHWRLESDSGGGLVPAALVVQI